MAATLLALAFAGGAAATIVVGVHADDHAGHSSADRSFDPPTTRVFGRATGTEATVAPGGFAGCPGGCGLLPGALARTHVDADGMRWRVGVSAYDEPASAGAEFRLTDTLLTTRVGGPVMLDFNVRIELDTVRANRGDGPHAGAEYTFGIGRWDMIDVDGREEFAIVETYLGIGAKVEDLIGEGRTTSFAAFVFGSDPVASDAIPHVFEATFSVPWNDTFFHSGDLRLAVFGGAGAFTEGLLAFAGVTSIDSAYVGISIGGLPVESANGYRYTGFVPAAVPAPSTAWLLLASALGACRLRRGR